MIHISRVNTQACFPCKGRVCELSVPSVNHFCKTHSGPQLRLGPFLLRAFSGRGKHSLRGLVCWILIFYILWRFECQDHGPRAALPGTHNLIFFFFFKIGFHCTFLAVLELFRDPRRAGVKSVHHHWVPPPIIWFLLSVWFALLG